MADFKFKYPCLFDVSDSKSLQFQKIYVRLNKFTLFLLVLSTILSAYSFEKKEINLISTAFLFISLTLTIILMVIKPEKGWYDGRAIAESIKSLSWKFVTGTTPFIDSLSLEEAEERLIKNFKKIIGQKKDFFSLVGWDFAQFEQITDFMRKLRESDLENRIKVYSANRLEEQKKWYSEKSTANRKNRSKYFTLIILFQLIAFASLIITYFFEIPIVLSPFFVCIASSLIAWLQLKKFQELTQSYSIAAAELSMIKSKLHHIKTQDDLSRFVDDAENAISREHTLWLARRGSIELFE